MNTSNAQRQGWDSSTFGKKAGERRLKQSWNRILKRRLLAIEASQAVYEHSLSQSACNGWDGPPVPLRDVSALNELVYSPGKAPKIAKDDITGLIEAVSKNTSV